MTLGTGAQGRQHYGQWNIEEAYAAMPPGAGAVAVLPLPPPP